MADAPQFLDEKSVESPPCSRRSSRLVVSAAGRRLRGENQGWNDTGSQGNMAPDRRTPGASAAGGELRWGCELRTGEDTTELHSQPQLLCPLFLLKKKKKQHT